MRRVLLVVACGVLVCAPTWAQTVYQVDDGTIEQSVGVACGGGPCDIWWANGFTAVAGAESIYEIRVAFRSGSGVSVGDPFSVHVYEDSDDDGDPNTGTLTLLASTNATVADATGETFQSILIGPVTVSGGFFVAGLFTHPEGEYPAAVDTTASQGQSWTNAGPAGLDPANPGSATNLDTLISGNYMLRAVGRDARAGIPALGGLGLGVFMVLLGAAGLLALRRQS